MLKHGFLEGIKDNLGRPVSVFLKLSAFRSLTLESQSNVQCVKELTMVQLSVGMATGAAYLGSKVAGHYLPRWGSMYIIFLIRLIFVMTEKCIYVYPQELWEECADVFPLHRLTAFVPTSLYHISSISIFQVFICR